MPLLAFFARFFAHLIVFFDFGAMFGAFFAKRLDCGGFELKPT